MIDPNDYLLVTIWALDAARRRYEGEYNSEECEVASAAVMEGVRDADLAKPKVTNTRLERMIDAMYLAADATEHMDVGVGAIEYSLPRLHRAYRKFGFGHFQRSNRW